MANASKIQFVFFNERTTTGNSPVLLVHGDYQAANIEITGTATSFECVVEGQVVSDEWVEISVVELSDINIVREITEKGVYQLDLTGWQKVRVKLNSIAGGNLHVKSKVVG